MKRILIAALVLLFALSLTGCRTRVVHCDRCGKEIKIPEKSDMTEDWIIICEECEAASGPAVVPRD